MATDIKEINKPTTIVDTSLNPPMNADFSSLKASMGGILQGMLDLTNQMKSTSEIKIPEQKQPTSIVDSITGKQQPQKTTADYIAERQQLQKDFLASQGITQEQFKQRDELSGQINSLNTQLRELDLQEMKEKDDIRRLAGAGTISTNNAEISKIERDYLFKKAMIASQGASLSAKYQVAQGKIDEANNLFTQAINYATTKERQDVEDYKWALNYYQDEDKETKDYIQQQYENAQNELKLRKPELREIGGNLYQYIYDPKTNSYTSTLLRSGGGTENNIFTQTQENKGAVNSGLSINEFNNLDNDTKNWFINNTAGLNELNKLSDKDRIDEINNNSTIPDNVKKILLKSSQVNKTPQSSLASFNESNLGWLNPFNWGSKIYDITH